MDRRAFLAGLGAGVPLALVGCAPRRPEGGAGGDADATLTVATTSDVVNYNPLIGNSRSDYWITNLMYPHLLDISAEGRKQAHLATDWGYTDPTTGFYEIRPDFAWSDGRPLTAEDVAWTLNAVKTDKPSGTFYGQLGNFETARAVSPTRLEVRLVRPDSSLIEEIGFWGNVVPRHIFEKAGSVADFANDGRDGGWVSAGPYRLTTVQAGQSYTLERVEPYPLVPGGRAGPATIVYRVFPDVNTEILALQSGEVDLIANAIPPGQVRQLQASGNLKLVEVPGLGYAHMTYNMRNADLARLPVRQALAYAVDNETIRQVALQGQARSTGSSPIVPALTDYFDPAGREYPFDIARSRQLMESAGYRADGQGMFAVRFRLLYSLQDPVTTQWANLVKDSSAQAGIGIDLQGLERNAYLARTNQGDFDIYAGNFAIMDDPVTNMSLTYRPGGAINYTYCDDPELDELITRAQQSLDQAERIALMRQAADLVRAQVYDNVLYQQDLYLAHSADWSGLVVKPSELLSVVNPVSMASARRG